uniref:WAP four-disulfide core domain protein 5-like n=1 Tax=Myxine glutinosa TaxID=7769 RepID=UPI00358F1354
MHTPLGTLSLVFTILAFNCKSSSSIGLPSGVSGPCPHHLTGEAVKHGCVSDGDCPEETHCCTLDCGPVCVSRTYVKQGVCPRSLPSGGVCAEYCANDSECPGVQKCCATTCGHQCADPYLVKPGRCPDPRPTGLCAEFCHHDGDCSGILKCCLSTCGHVCADPCE